MDIRKITMAPRDANTQWVRYEGGDLGYLVISGNRGQWPYASIYVYERVQHSGPYKQPPLRTVYWPMVVYRGQGYRMPCKLSKIEAGVALKKYADSSPEEQETLRALCKLISRMDDLRAQDPNHADLAALSEQVKHLSHGLNDELRGI